MAANLTKKTKKELHSFVMEVLSTYDVDNKLVQKFISSIAKDINTKYGQLNEKTNTQGGVIEKVFNTSSKRQVRSDKEETTSQYQAVKETSSKTFSEYPVETSNTNQAKNIFQQLLKEKDKGLIGITRALLKQRETADGEKSSYFNRLKESATSKNPLDNTKNIIRELFKPLETYTKKLETSQTTTEKLEVPRSKNTENETSEQQLDLIKDEEGIQRVSIDNIGPAAIKGIQTAIENSIPKLSSSTPTSAKNTNTAPQEESGSGLGILGTLAGIKYLKDLFKTKIPTRAKTIFTRPSTIPSTAKETPSKPITTKTSKKETTTAKEAIETIETETKTVGKEASKVGAKEVLETGAKTTGKEVLETGAKTAGKEVVKAGAKTAGKEAAKVGAKTVGKSLLKKIPGVGLIAGLGFGAQRALSGDWTGAGLEFASGAASTIPGVGTAASLGIDAAIAGRDIYNEVNQPTTPEASGASNLVEEAPTISPTPPSVLPADNPAQKFTPIQEPTKPITDKSSALLETIANNTNNTNNQIANLTQAILKLAGALGNSKVPSVPPFIMPPQQQQNNSPSMSQIASNNFDPIRAVRSNFAVA